MRNRPKITEAVFVAVLDGDKVLLQKRQNTGWLDGNYDLPGGHLEAGETFTQAAAREAQEESGVNVSPDDLKLFHICQNATNNPYTYIMFKTGKWSGQPATSDPQYVDEVKFFPVSDLPENTAPYIKKALENINQPEVTFAYFDKDSNERS